MGHCAGLSPGPAAVLSPQVATTKKRLQRLTTSPEWQSHHPSLLSTDIYVQNQEKEQLIPLCNIFPRPLNTGLILFLSII